MHVTLQKDRFSQFGLDARVDDAPEWFGPAIRGSIMQGTPVLALDEYEEHWREAWFAPEVIWNRIQLFPIVTGFPQLEGGRISLRASNRLFACSITRVPHTGGFALSMRSLTPKDVARDPEPMCKPGESVRIALGDDLRITAKPDSRGQWTVDLCTPDTVRYTASQETFRADAERWRSQYGQGAVLAQLQRLAWRVVEPCAPNCPTEWLPLPAEPAVWRSQRDEAGGCTSFRLERHAELEADEKDSTNALGALGGVTVYEENGRVTLEPERDVPSAFVRVSENNAFVLKDAPDTRALGALDSGLWVVSHTPSGGVSLSAYAPRNDTLKIYGSCLYPEPLTIRPPRGSDADWSSMLVCHLSRGDSVRFRCTAKLGTGVLPRWACACGGVPVFRPTLHPGGWSAAALERPPSEIEYHPSAWVVRVEPVGQLTAEEILLASSESLSESFDALAESLEYAYDDVAPKLAFFEDSVGN